MIRVGTAGWSFPDWEGIVYPKGASTRPLALQTLARMFDTVEINVTFYRPPTPRMAGGWVTRVASHPSFTFAAKLWRGFTHERDERHDEEERAFREGLGPLMEASRLGALLAQFPQSFVDNPANRRYLRSLIGRFGDYPLVVELRHASWLEGDALEMLGETGTGFCNIDQPLIGKAVPPTTVVTGRIGYVRLHGRNAADWFRRDAGRDRRYDYLYSHEEIKDWVERVRLMQKKGKGDADIFIIANNHYRGQAPANAIEIVHALTGRRVEAPESLLEAFPRLKQITTISERTGRLPL